MPKLSIWDLIELDNEYLGLPLLLEITWIPFGKTGFMKPVPKALTKASFAAKCFPRNGKSFYF